MNEMKKKKLMKGLGLFLGLGVLLYFIVNLGFNYWLRSQLPKIIKENLPYQVQYEKISVELSSGTISLKNINIQNKQYNPTQLGIEGSVSALRIEDLGIWDAVKNKKINANRVYFENPNLKIRLPKPTENSSESNQGPLKFQNVNVKNGNIQLTKFDQSKMLSVDNLNLKITNFRLTEKGVKQKLPVVFDDYSISGDNFVFYPDEVYQLSTKKIISQDRQMVLKDFSLIPVENLDQVMQKYPKKSSVYYVSSQEMTFKDVEFNEDKLSFNKIQLNTPDVKIVDTGVITPKSEGQDFNLPVDLDQVEILNGHFLQTDVSGKTQLKVGNFNAKAFKIAVNNQPNQKKKVSYSYGDYHFKINDVEVAKFPNSEYKVKAMDFDNKNAYLFGVNVVSGSGHKKVQFSVPKISLLEYAYSPNEQVSKLKAKTLKIDGIQGSLFSGLFKGNGKKKSASPSHENLDVNIDQVVLGNSNLKILNESGGNLFDINQLKFNVKGFQLNNQTLKSTIPFHFKNFSGETHQFSYQPNRYSKLGFSTLKLDDKNLYVENFSFLPTTSRKAFLASLKQQEDLYTVKIPKLSIQNYVMNFSKKVPELNIDRLRVEQMFMNIYSYNGEHPPADHKPRTFFNEKLRNIKIPFVIKQTDIQNATLEYEETDDQAVAPGKIAFLNTNLSVANLNSGKMNPKQSVVKIEANTRFFQQGYTQVSWWFDVNNRQDNFGFKANISNLDAAKINSFIKPYLHISASGHIDQVDLNFSGNNAQLVGSYGMKAQNLKMEILSKDNSKKKVFQSMLANWVIPKQKNIPPKVPILVDRKEKRSFFNFLWKGIEQGLQRSLIDEKAPEKIEKVKKTIDDVSETTSEVTSKISKTTKKVVKEEKNIFRKIFKKKEDKK